MCDFVNIPTKFCSWQKRNQYWKQKKNLFWKNQSNIGNRERRQKRK